MRTQNGIRAALLTACLAAAGAPAVAAVRTDVLQGMWRDDFTDLSGLIVNQQGGLAAPSGFTIDSNVQTLTWPYSTTGFSQAFTAAGSTRDPTVVVGSAGSTAEYLTLWNARYDPGVQLDVPYTCESWKGESCKSQNNFYQNGDAVDRYVRNAPYEGTNWLPAAGWDTKNDQAFSMDLMDFIHYIYCRVPKSPTDGTPNPPGMSTFLGSPILGGLSLMSSDDPSTAVLYPRRGYTATFTAGALLFQHITHTGTAYLMCQVYDRTARTATSVTLYESQFYTATIPAAAGGATPGPSGIDFTQLTTLSVHLDPARNISGHRYDLQMYFQVPPREPGTDWGCSHCTMVGPVWLTADDGHYNSAVYDTLSVATRWVDICWKADMSTTYIDSLVSGLPPGMPLTPIRLSYSVSSGGAALLPTTWTVTHGGETIAGRIGMNMVTNACNSIHDAAGLPVTGRYFQWGADLFGRAASAGLDPDLAPAPPSFYFGGFRPILRQVMVHYYVCAARAQSKRIVPTSVRRWRTVDYVVEKPSPAATVRVDVLGPDGEVLLPDVASGASLGGLDPYRYPSLSLRAVMESDPADCAMRPILRAWQVTWEPLADILELACNSIRPALGEECRMQIRMDRAGPVRVEVHDAAGQSVRVLLDAELPAEARMLSWNARNEAGQLVATGVYFVAARVPGGRRVRKLAVIR